jgi:hypothetical protein
VGTTVAPQTVVNVEVKSDGSSTVSAQGSTQDLQKFGKLIGDSVRKTIADESRPGGMVYKIVKNG